MAAYGYGSVTDKGFLAFGTDLGAGEWGAVSLGNHSFAGPQQSESLLSAPRPLTWKLRIGWALEDLARASGNVSAEALLGLDTTWDTRQRKLHFTLASEEQSEDPARKAAASRLRTSLLDGGEVAQTILSYDEEVDFGRRQVLLAARPEVKVDVDLLGLGAQLAEIGAATEALATALGRGPGTEHARPRSARIKDAVNGCVTAFNGVRDDIEWMLEHTKHAQERTTLQGLLAPLQALRDRFPRDKAAGTPAETLPTVPA